MILAWLILLVATGVFAYGGVEYLFDAFEARTCSKRMVLEFLSKCCICWLAAWIVGTYLFQLVQSHIGGL